MKLLSGCLNQFVEALEALGNSARYHLNELWSPEPRSSRLCRYKPKCGLSRCFPSRHRNTNICSSLAHLIWYFVYFNPDTGAIAAIERLISTWCNKNCRLISHRYDLCRPRFLMPSAIRSGILQIPATYHRCLWRITRTTSPITVVVPVYVLYRHFNG